MIEIPQPKSHEASVVRCSSCGGVRSGSETSCSFCSASFTLHERDLHTVCPECLARISDTARYCHHCATPITPIATAGEQTPFECPVCGPDRHLVSRSFTEDKQTIALECGDCGGLWLDNRIFEMVESRAIEKAMSDFTRSSKGVDRKNNYDQKGPFYRNCPHCKSMMQRRNYGGKSGVLVDSCLTHGIWFDLGELETILRWVRAGGLRTADANRLSKTRRDQSVKEFNKKMDGATVKTIGGAPQSGSSAYIVDAILDFFFHHI